MIRTLQPGEPVPPGEPKRYKSGKGYIRLRWRVGPGEWVEVYEHRVVDGRAATVDHVHHINEVKDDNRPSNLAFLTEAEHAKRHRRIDRESVEVRYRSGETMASIADDINCDPSAVSRVLRSRGVEARAKADYAPDVGVDALRSLCSRPGFRVPQVAEALGLSHEQVRRLMRIHGIPSFPAGRPRKAG